MAAAEVARRHLAKPDGTVEPCWVVTGYEEQGDSIVVFSGNAAADRAVAYARERYSPLHFRMTAEPGRYNTHGAEMNGESA